MKYIFLIIFSTISFSQNIDYWVDEFKKRVYFVPAIEMNISLVITKVSAQAWSRLVIDTEYTDQGLDNDPQYRNLKLKFPEYSFRALNPELSFSENVHVSIPALSKEKNVELRAGVLGPYFHGWFDLNKEETQKVKEMIQYQAKLVSLRTALVANFKINTIMEHYEISNSICDRIFSQGNNTFYVLKQYFKNISKFKKERFKYLSTYENLKAQVLNNCIMQDLNISISSFDDLLGQRLYQNNEKSSIIGQTIKVENKSESINLRSIHKTFEELK